MSHEIGKPLGADQLIERTVVVIEKYDGLFVTLWVKDLIRQDGKVAAVALFAGTIGITLLLMVQPDGSLIDSSNTVIRVFEYRGEIGDYAMKA